MIVRRAFGVALFVVAAAIAGGLLRAQPAAPLTPDLYKQLKFRYIGPVGNRVIAIAGVPANPNIYYAGAASGGIFKTTDAGAHWDAVFDDQPVSSIGSLAVAPSDPNVSGPAPAKRSSAATSRSATASTSRPTPAERGRTPASTRPAASAASSSTRRNPDVVIACALGNAYGPQQERGVFRTADGGKTWDRELFVDQNTGCSDVAMDATNPRDSLRRHVADRNPHLGPHERRTGQRPVQVDRRRHHLEAPDRPRPAEGADRQSLAAGRSQ